VMRGVSVTVSERPDSLREGICAECMQAIYSSWCDACGLLAEDADGPCPECNQPTKPHWGFALYPLGGWILTKRHQMCSLLPGYKKQLSEGRNYTE
jgi:hypothetical protein